MRKCPVQHGVLCTIDVAREKLGQTGTPDEKNKQKKRSKRAVSSL